MKTKTLVLTAVAAATVAVAPTYAYAVCSPSSDNVGPVARAVSEELAALAPYKDGADRRDLAWAKENLVAMVPDWMPNAKRVATQAKPDIEALADECYQSGDTNPDGPVMADFISCVKKGLLTEMAPKYVPELPVLCDEVSQTLDDPAVVDKSREWTRQWVNKFIEYRNTRPSL